MKQFLFICLILLAFNSYSQKITRGPDIGEVYFLGPTATDVLYSAIYHSTDFGETAVCVDSVSALSNSIESITADKTPGGLYFVTMTEQLFYSENYGQFGSWLLRNSDIYIDILSGRNEGEIFNSIVSHSTDYGLNFINHSFNGFFGSLKDVEIDNSNNIGYCIAENYGVADTQYFFISYDNYENLEVVSKFNFVSNELTEISRGNQAGELFLINKNTNKLYFTYDYGQNWDFKNSFTCPYLPIEGITGGRQDGEIYVLVVYRQGMGYIRHVYIYHSSDYGESFTIHHPVSVGPEPAYADFIADDTLGEPPFEVHYTDLSSSPMSWEWDFDNDGTVDSYEQNPTFIYEDTGYYTVKLTIQYYSIEDYAIRYEYIHVTDLTNTAEPEVNSELIFYPNPFTNLITFEFLSAKNQGKIFIYDIAGQLINTLQKLLGVKKLVWNGKDKSGNNCTAGIYYVRSGNNTFSKKILLIK